MRPTLVSRTTRARGTALHSPFTLPNSLCFSVPWLLALSLSVGCRPLSPQRAEPGPPPTLPPAVAALAPVDPPLPSAASQAEMSRKLAGVALPFIANQGQYDARVKFYAPTFGGTLFVTSAGELMYALSQQGKEKEEASKGVVLTEALVGGRVSAVSGEGQAPTKVNVFHGHDPAKWQRHIPTYERVSLGEVYEGVELKLAAYGKRVEKLFYVQPGADPEQIRVKLSGGHVLKVNGQGELEVETALGEVTVSKPVAYQEEGGQKEFIEVAYAVEGEEYGFVVGVYDRGKELVIDPILAATFLGAGVKTLLTPSPWTARAMPTWLVIHTPPTFPGSMPGRRIAPLLVAVKPISPSWMGS